VITAPNSRVLLSYFAVLAIYKLFTERLTTHRPKVILKSLTGPLNTASMQLKQSIVLDSVNVRSKPLLAVMNTRVKCILLYKANN
jgi:hypothetical protein